MKNLGNKAQTTRIKRITADLIRVNPHNQRNPCSINFKISTALPNGITVNRTAEQ